MGMRNARYSCEGRTHRGWRLFGGGAPFLRESSREEEDVVEVRQATTWVVHNNYLWKTTTWIPVEWQGTNEELVGTALAAVQATISSHELS